MRALLRVEFQVYFWLEITADRSYHAYRGLDLYIAYCCAEADPGIQEAHYLLNTELPWHLRSEYYPEQWYLCHNHASVGQKHRINEWYLEVDSPMLFSRL